MGISQYDPAAEGRLAWSAGKQVGAKRALKVKQIWLIQWVAILPDGICWLAVLPGSTERADSFDQFRVDFSRPSRQPIPVRPGVGQLRAFDGSVAAEETSVMVRPSGPGKEFRRYGKDEFPRRAPCLRSLLSARPL